jgi:nucleotide-binding universal stress UspA family protein
MPIAEEKTMFKHILVPLDGSTLSEKALGIATAIARATAAKVTLLNSVSTTTYAYVAAPIGGMAFEQMTEATVIHSTNYLKKVAQRLHDCGVADV